MKDLMILLGSGVSRFGNLAGTGVPMNMGFGNSILISSVSWAERLVLMTASAAMASVVCFMWGIGF
jgi:hypothetical protein